MILRSGRIKAGAIPKRMYRFTGRGRGSIRTNTETLQNK